MQSRSRRSLISEIVPGTSTSGGSSKNILDVSLTQSRGQVNLDAYLMLFAEVVSYSRDRVESVSALQDKLAELGYRHGRRVLELTAAREKIAKRETQAIDILKFTAGPIWIFLFGKQADCLRRVQDSVSDYYIEDSEPLVNRYISVPADYGHFNCAAFIAGIIHGVLESAGFPSTVAAKLGRIASDESQPRQMQTVYVIQLDPEVVEREAQRLSRLRA